MALPGVNSLGFENTNPSDISITHVLISGALDGGFANTLSTALSRCE